MGFLQDNGLEDQSKVESETTPKTEEKEETSSEETQEKSEESSQETSEEKSEEVKAEEVPASFQKRINELTYRYKSEREARTKLEEELKKSRQNPAQPTSEEEKREQSAREYLRGLLKEELAATKSQEDEEDKKLSEEIDHVSALYPDFNREKVLKVMEKYGIDNVEKAYLASKEMAREAEVVKEKTKKEILAKPKSPSSVKTQDGAATKFSEKDISEKSIYELAEQAKREAGLS